MSVPSLGLIAVITTRKITSPSGMPTTIAIAPSAAPPALTTPSTPRGVRPTRLEDREVARSLAGHQQQRGQQVDEPDGDEQRARAEQDRADVGALLADLVLGELGGDGRRRLRAARGAAPSVPGAKSAITSLAPRPAPAAWRGEDQHLAVVVGLDVAADERERDRLAADAHGERSPTSSAERARRGRGRRSPRRGAANMRPSGTA